MTMDIRHVAQALREIYIAWAVKGHDDAPNAGIIEAILGKVFPGITSADIADADCLITVRCYLNKGEALPGFITEHMSRKQLEMAAALYSQSGVVGVEYLDHATALAEYADQRSTARKH